VEIATDAMVAEPLARWASARARDARGRSHVYRYRFDHPGAGRELGATHTAEVPLLFGTWSDGGAGERLGGRTPGAAEVANEVVAAWGCFLHGDTPGWAAIGEGDPVVRVFGGSAARGSIPH
jgi:carboxylesterase type B